MSINRISYFIVFVISVALTAWMPAPTSRHVFYMAWGPAQRYTADAISRFSAGRPLDITVKSLVALVVFALAANYCRRSIAAVAAILALFWQMRENSMTSPAVAVCLLSLCGVAALLPTYISWISRQKLAVAGCLSALCFLFSYPAGGALLAVQVLVLGSVAIWHTGSPRVPFWLEKSVPVVAAFVVVSAPCAWLFRKPVPQYPTIAEYGFVGMDGLQKVVALLVAAAAVSGFLIAWRRGAQLAGPDGQEREMRRCRGFLVAFSLLALAMLCLGQIYLSGMPALLVLALLIDRGSSLRGFRTAQS
jgi:hypothetical protein